MATITTVRSSRPVATALACASWQNLDKTFLQLFYKNVRLNGSTVSMICWYWNLSVWAKAALSKILTVSSKVMGTRQICLTDLFNSFSF